MNFNFHLPNAADHFIYYWCGCRLWHVPNMNIKLFSILIAEHNKWPVFYCVCLCVCQCGRGDTKNGTRRDKELCENISKVWSSEKASLWELRRERGKVQQTVNRIDKHWHKNLVYFSTFFVLSIVCFQISSTKWQISSEWINFFHVNLRRRHIQKLLLDSGTKLFLFLQKSEHARAW
jgi:hypothetical protein